MGKSAASANDKAVLSLGGFGGGYYNGATEINGASGHYQAGKCIGAIKAQETSLVTIIKTSASAPFRPLGVQFTLKEGEEILGEFLEVSIASGKGFYYTGDDINE